MVRSYLLCGVGGQGTVLASKLIAAAAMEKGENVRTAETIGMAQRGGCVVSHVRVGDDVHSPLVPKGSADVIIGFEPAEAVRCLSYLKADGTVIVNAKAIKPVTSTLSESSYNGSEMLAYLGSCIRNLIVVDGESVCESCGSQKVLNIALLAAGAKAGCLDITVDELKSIILKRVSLKFQVANLNAVDMICCK